LDKLTNKEQFKKNSKVDGLKMLREFIVDPVSLTSAKKRNEQQKKWEYYLQERLAAGLPAYAA
jgi:predicted methyltransferase